MNFLIKTSFIYIVYYFLFFIEIINSKNVINILINRPNIGDIQYLEKYNQLINQYVVSKNIDFDINFSYCVPEPTDGESLSFLYQVSNTQFSVDTDYARNFNCTLRELKSSNYDMMILDDKFLFSDDSYIENVILESMFSFQKFTDFYVNYNDYGIQEEDISHHHPEILKDGKTSDNELYGLPFELDFDLLYYYDDATASKDLLSTKINNFSELNNIGSEGILSTGLNDNDELINLFVEFIRYQYDIPKDDDPLSYDKLYDENSDEIYDSFREYILQITGKDMENALSASIEDAYNSFVSGEKRIFKGKASYNNYFNTINNSNQTITISASSLPDGMSVISEKYLVINKNSAKSMDQLVQVALQLTSSDFQIYRAKELGFIPTFDFSNKSDTSISTYCGDHSDICSLIDSLNSIRITKVLRKSRYSANYLESRLIIPFSLRNSLSAKDNIIIKKTLSNILNIWNNFLESFTLSPLIVAMLSVNAFMFITVIYLLIVIVMVHRNRKHPYIKAMSPQLTNIAIFGMILKIVYPTILNVIRTNFLCRLNVVINFFIDNLVYTPLFAIIFRIYYIYTNVSNMSCGKKLHDTRLIRYIILVLFLTFLAFFGLTSFDKFYLITTGSLALTRSIACTYDYAKYTLYINIYIIVM
eukprot:jgi/Orpsp1_1/1176858/evm.model.c7180000059288.1